MKNIDIIQLMLEKYLIKDLIYILLDYIGKYTNHILIESKQPISTLGRIEICNENVNPFTTYMLMVNANVQYNGNIKIFVNNEKYMVHNIHNGHSMNYTNAYLHYIINSAYNIKIEIEASDVMDPFTIGNYQITMIPLE